MTEQRNRRALALKMIFPVLAILIAFIATGLIIYLLGFNPFEAYAMMISGSFGNLNAIGETIVSAIPLIFSALSFAIAYKSGVFNIGVEGQIYIGALFTILVGTLKGMHPAIQLPLTVLAGFVGGGLWGLLVGWLKVRFGAKEMITSIMLNYVATIFVSYCVSGPLKEQSGSGMSQTEAVAEGIRLTRFIPGTRLHTGLFLALAAIIFFGIFIWKSNKGYELRVMGQNPSAAEYAGIPIKFNTLLVMLLSGGIAGLAGCVEILALQGRLIAGFAGSVGFNGITVALLGDCTPVGILLSALLFGALNSGSNKMEMLVGVPSATVSIMQGIIILAVVSRIVFERKPFKMKRKGKRKEKGEARA